MTTNNSLSGASPLSGASDIRPKLSALIKDLCPHGVEWKTLGEVATLSRGKVYSKEYLRDNAGEYPVYSSQTANNGELGRISTYDYDGKYLTWTTDGAYAGTVFRREGKFSITNVCGLISNVDKALSIDFLYYWLNKVAKGYVYQGMGNPKLMSNVMETIEIPLPPLEIQEKIVECLDKFSALAAELQAELHLRRKQYEYYRTQLLTPHSDGNSATTPDDCNWEWKTLGEVCEFQNGFSFQSSKFKESGSPVLRITNIKDSQIDEESLVCFDKSDYREDLTRYCVLPQRIVVAMSGATTGKVGMNRSNNIYYLNQRVGMFIPDEKYLYNNYLFHFLSTQSENLYYLAGGGAQPNLSTKAINNLVIPIPPLAEQKRIADLLDKFEALTTSLSDGIPAEQAAQQKRYEYYRDLLLTFPRKEA